MREKERERGKGRERERERENMEKSVVNFFFFLKNLESRINLIPRSTYSS